MDTINYTNWIGNKHVYVCRQYILQNFLLLKSECMSSIGMPILAALDNMPTCMSHIILAGNNES